MSEKKFSTYRLAKQTDRPFWYIAGYDSKGKKRLLSSGTKSKKEAELIGQALVDSDWEEIEGRLTKNLSRVPTEVKAFIKELADKGESVKDIGQKVYEKFNLELGRSTISENTGRPPKVAKTLKELNAYLKKYNLSLTGDYQAKRARVNTHSSRQAQKGKNPEITYSYQDELRNFKKAGLSINSPEVQKFIDKRAGDKFHSLKSKAKVYSYETANGEIKPESKKLVANLIEAKDEKEIRQLARDVVEKQAMLFFEKGKIPDVDDLDHIFPFGSTKIIDGKLVGGTISPDGVFQGVGLTNRKNLQALSRVLNRSSQNVLTPEKLAQLGVGEFKPSTREGSLARILQLGQWQRGETDASGKPVRKPIARRGVFLSSLPWVGSLFTLGMAGLPGRSEAKTTMGRVGENLTNPYFLGDMVTGLDTEGLLGDMQKSHLERHGETYSDRAKRSVVGSAFLDLMDYAKKKKDNLFDYQPSSGGW